MYSPMQLVNVIYFVFLTNIPEPRVAPFKIVSLESSALNHQRRLLSSPDKAYLTFPNTVKYYLKIEYGNS